MSSDWDKSFRAVIQLGIPTGNSGKNTVIPLKVPTGNSENTLSSNSEFQLGTLKTHCHPTQSSNWELRKNTLSSHSKFQLGTQEKHTVIPLKVPTGNSGLFLKHKLSDLKITEVMI
jgi:hypothetical protein